MPTVQGDTLRELEISILDVQFLFMVLVGHGQNATSLHSLPRPAPTQEVHLR